MDKLKNSGFSFLLQNVHLFFLSKFYCTNALKIIIFIFALLIFVYFSLAFSFLTISLQNGVFIFLSLIFFQQFDFIPIVFNFYLTIIIFIHVRLFIVCFDNLLFRSTGSTLVLQNIGSRDAGIYTCTAQNIVGSISTQFNVQVQLDLRALRASLSKHNFSLNTFYLKKILLGVIRGSKKWI